MTLCHLDDRNRQKIESLAHVFSEFNLARTRIDIEIAYLLALSRVKIVVPPLTQQESKFLLNISSNFNELEFSKLKATEKKVNHDVKAIEYYLRSKIVQKDLKRISSFIHFGLTSEDVNNLAYGILLSQTKQNIILPRLVKILEELKNLAKKSQDFAMLARTHGQPAVPTTFGKEVAVFVKRLKQEINILKNLEIEGKLNGAVGNYNALYLCYPKVDWLKFSEQFIKSLNTNHQPLTTNLFTTQILPYDSWIRHFDSLKRINNILLSLVTDFWWYCSLGYLKLRVINQEVGSSAMPQKVNPIDLEAAEGNLGFSNSMLQFFSDKLSKTRLQHDLSDSTVRRNIGLALGYSYFAYDSILRALSRLEPDKEIMLVDLNNHREVLAEAITSLLKINGYNNAYEELKQLTRGKKITEQILKDLVKKHKLPKAIKDKLLSLTPETYLGLATKLTKHL